MGDRCEIVYQINTCSYAACSKGASVYGKQASVLAALARANSSVWERAIWDGPQKKFYAI